MTVLVTGVPHTGKTPLATILAKRLGYALIHTDDYMDMEWPVVPVVLFEELKPLEPKVVMEGVAGARLLSRGLMPDLVVICTRDGLGKKAHKGMAVVVNKKLRAFEQQHPSRVARVCAHPVHRDVVDWLVRRVQGD